MRHGSRTCALTREPFDDRGGGETAGQPAASSPRPFPASGTPGCLGKRKNIGGTTIDAVLGGPPVASPGESAEITRLLKAWGGGDSAALDRLTPLVYEQLRRMARRYMRNERPGHTLQTTALVNEAFLRLVDTWNVDWTDRAHFYAVCAQVM